MKIYSSDIWALIKKILGAGILSSLIDEEGLEWCFLYQKKEIVITVNRKSHQIFSCPGKHIDKGDPLADALQYLKVREDTPTEMWLAACFYATRNLRKAKRGTAKK